MSANYDLVIKRPTGEFVAEANLQDFMTLDYTLKTNAVGAMTLTLPASRYPISMFNKDYRIEIWRKPRGGSAYLEGETCWFVNHLDQTRSTSTLMAETANTLLKRRIVTYQDIISEANVLKVEPLDNMIKDACRENGFITSMTGSYTIPAPDTTRSWQTYAAVAANTSTWNGGDSFRRRITHDVLLDVAVACAAKAADNPPENTLYFFDIVQTRFDNLNPFLEVRTYMGQRRADRRSTIILSEKEQTLSDTKLVLDWTDEVNRFYAGGPGQKALRIFALAEDPALPGAITTNPFFVRERFFDGRKAQDLGETQGSARDQLSRPENKPYREFSGSITESSLLQYGVHYFHGDRVAAFEFGQFFDVSVNIVHVHVEEGKEVIETKVSDKLNVFASGLTKVLRDVNNLQRIYREISSIDTP